MNQRPTPALASRLTAAMGLLIWAGIVLAASQAPTMRLWGLNYLAFTPPEVRWWFFAAAGVAVILVLYPGPLGIRLSSASDSPVTIPWHHALLLALLVGAAGWLLHARVGLLGDGIMRASDAVQIPTAMPSELLPSALSMFLVRNLPNSWGIDGYTALRLISVASGLVLTLGLCRLAPKAGIKHPYWFIFWLLTFGWFRLFAGYIETYAPAAAFTVLWALASLAYQRGNAHAITVVGLWVCAAVSHATMMVLAPATAFVLLWGRETSHPNWRPAIMFVIIAAGLGTFIGMRLHSLQIEGVGAGPGYFLLPLLPKPPHEYGILSLTHFADLLNQLLLLVPAFLFAVAGTLRGNRTDRDFEPHARGVFWFLAAGLPIVAGLLLDPKLGWARDWDLFTLFCAPFMVGAAVWLARLDASPVRRAAASVAVMSLGLWLVFSINADAETRRFKALLDLDPSRGDYGHEILALHYREINDPDNEIEQYKRALAVTDNIRYRGNIAAACVRAGRYDEAVEWYQGILKRDSTFEPAIYGMAIGLQYLGRFDDALPYAEAAVRANPQDPERQFTLGSIQSRLRDFESALPHLEFAARARPDDIDYLNPLGGCYLQLKRYQEARTVWQQVVKVDPDFSPVYLNASVMELSTGHYAESRRLLAEYERLVPADQRRPEAQWLADSLSRIGP